MGQRAPRHSPRRQSLESRRPGPPSKSQFSWFFSPSVRWPPGVAASLPMLKEMPLRERDSSGGRKSISQPGVFPEYERRLISPRMVKAQRVAIVTGASQGIGAGLVAGYRRLGFGI